MRSDCYRLWIPSPADSSGEPAQIHYRKRFDPYLFHVSRSEKRSPRRGRHHPRRSARQRSLVSGASAFASSLLCPPSRLPEHPEIILPQTLTAAAATALISRWIKRMLFDQRRPLVEVA